MRVSVRESRGYIRVKVRLDRDEDRLNRTSINNYREVYQPCQPRRPVLFKHTYVLGMSTHTHSAVM